MADSLRTPASCEACGDTGWARTTDGNVTRVVRCACWLAARQTYADGTPFEFQAARLANYRELPGNAAALKAARDWLDDTRDLYLCGGVGAGKTRLAASILNELHHRTGRGWFVRVPMLLLKLLPARDADAAAESNQLLRRLTTEPVIVLDDIGAERDRASDFTRRTLHTAYEERGDQGLRTIWTSNLRIAPKAGEELKPGRPPVLAEFLGDDRLPSRIAGRAQVVMLTTPDQRLQHRTREDR